MPGMLGGFCSGSSISEVTIPVNSLLGYGDGILRSDVGIDQEAHRLGVCVTLGQGRVRIDKPVRSM